MVYISPDILVPARILLTGIQRRHLLSPHVNIRQTVTTLVVALRQLSPMALVDPHHRAVKRAVRTIKRATQAIKRAVQVVSEPSKQYPPIQTP